MSHSYPSDISRAQFARILPMLESASRRTKPRTVDLYDVFCGVLYLLKGGCQWRMLPADFPDWRTCYKYFRHMIYPRPAGEICLIVYHSHPVLPVAKTGVVGMAVVQQKADPAGEVEWEVHFVDQTGVRVHQHAAATNTSMRSVL